MDEKFDGLGARILEDLLVVLPLELAGSSESVVVLVLPHLLRSSSEDDGSTSFLEQKAADETESSVDDELNPCGKKTRRRKGARRDQSKRERREVRGVLSCLETKLEFLYYQTLALPLHPLGCTLLYVIERKWLTLDPTPSLSCENESRVHWSRDGTEDRRESEH